MTDDLLEMEDKTLRINKDVEQKIDFQVKIESDEDLKK